MTVSREQLAELSSRLRGLAREVEALSATVTVESPVRIREHRTGTGARREVSYHRWTDVERDRAAELARTGTPVGLIRIALGLTQLSDAAINAQVHKALGREGYRAWRRRTGA